MARVTKDYPDGTKTAFVKIVRGYFPEDGSKKLPVGTEIDLPLDEAKRLIAEGVAVRNDPL